MFRTKLIKSALLALACSMAFSVYADAPQRIEVAAGDIVTALESLAKQANVELVFQAKELKGIRTAGVKGTYAPEEAVALLLKGTSLRIHTDSSGAMFISAPAVKDSGKAAASTQSGRDAGPTRLTEARMESMQKVEESASSESSPPASSAEGKGVPDILVKGSRMINADIKRTEDDPQPYVVFDAQEIESSQATNLEDFLRTRLPMNTSSDVYSQQEQSRPVTLSSISLRGLGQSQTLILVDGRRAPRIIAPTVTGGFTFHQADVNGIPLAAVQRIEVLPSTAGGIYGGSATGGVINIIMKRDYAGMDVKVTHVSAFDTDTGTDSFDVSGGFSFEGGRTHVMLTANHADSNLLLVGDRDFAERGRALLLANNPAALMNGYAPPIGETVNIRSDSGNLVLDQAYGGRALGATFTHIPLGYAGPSSDAGAALVANAGTYSLGLPNDMNGLQQSLFATPTTQAASLNLRREFSRHLDAFMDVSTSSNEGISHGSGVTNSVSLAASAPNNPFQQNISVSFPTPNLSTESHSQSTTLRAAAGLIARLPNNWTGEMDYSWSRSRFEGGRITSPVDNYGIISLGSGLPGQNGGPALNALQEGNTFPINFSSYLLPPSTNFDGPYDTILRDVTLRLSGPVVTLSGGALVLSALIEHREEEAQDAISQSMNTRSRAPIYSFYPHRSQDVDSYYLEANMPVVSGANELPFVRELELQASIRRDEYATTTHLANYGLPLPSPDGPFPQVNYVTALVESTDYTLGLRYQPLRDLTVRASFGTGFLPPAISQLVSNEFLWRFGRLYSDPKRGGVSGPGVGGEGNFTVVDGGNPNLVPEQSESWSAGMIFTPRFADGLRISIDYTRVGKTNEIKPIYGQYILDDEGNYPGRVVRAALTPADAALGFTAGIVTRLDQTLLNIAQTAVEACDFQVNYDLQTMQRGNFNLYALATWQPHLKNRTLAASPFVDLVGFNNGPLEWRGNFGVNWNQGPITVGWNAQYYDSYLVYFSYDAPSQIAAATLNQGSPTIPSQIYHDIRATYRPELEHGLFSNMEISLGIRNVLNKSLPILANVNVTGGYSTYGDPRLRTYSISLRKSFQ